MKILYFSRGYGPHDHRFLAAISALGHDVYFLRLFGEGTLESRPLPAGVRPLEPLRESRIQNPVDYLHAYRNLHRQLRGIEPELVHAGPIPDVTWLVSLTGFQPLVSMSWGSDLMLEARAGLQRIKASQALRHSEAMICDCDAVRQAGIQLGMPEEKIVVFPWGIDLDKFSPRSGRAAGERVVLLSTRSLEPLYGVDVVLEAFIIAQAQDPRLFLKVAGDGSMRTNLESKVQHTGLREDVEFLGQVEYADLPELYRSADLYVSASHSDGSSVSLLEAMGSGLPAIVSDIPGNREWVTPGSNGSWFEDGSAEDLAEKIIEISQDPPAMQNMGKLGREIVESRADWKHNWMKIDEAYRIAMKGLGGG